MSPKNPYIFAVLIQCIYAGMMLLSKAAFNGGMNVYIFVFYRQLVGTVFLYPFAIIFERKATASLTFVSFCKIFFLALLGMTIALNMLCLGILYTSATLAAAAVNCLPVMTIFFAFLFGIEKLNVKTRAGIAKAVGIMLSIGGVGILAFYKGPSWKPQSFGHIHSSSTQHHGYASSSKSWIIGCSVLFFAMAAWALWLVLQARVLESYPLKLYFTSIQCLSSTIQSFVVAIAMERDPSQWKLGWNLRLLAVVYSGVMVTGVAFYLLAWVIMMKGPVFQAISTPFNLIITTIGSVLFLGDPISLSSILGGILFVGSLYSVLWGKSKEAKEAARVNDGNVENNCNAEVKEQEMKRNEGANHTAVNVENSADSSNSADHSLHR